MKENKTLSDEIVEEAIYATGITRFIKVKPTKSYLNKLKKMLKDELLKPPTHTTHSCPNEDEDYECSCVNPKIPDQNFYCIEKRNFNKIFDKAFKECLGKEFK